MTHALTAVSLMAANVQPAHRALIHELGRRAGLPIRFVEEVGWQERTRMLECGEAQLGFICGFPYVKYTAGPDPLVRLLAAPVMQGTRYAGQPIYFSDVLVRRTSPYQTFDDLRGASWAYNEPGSLSGYLITCHHLATLGESGAFFGRSVESGAHLRSLELVVAGKVDATAIDSTVWELELRRRPDLGKRLRVIATLGPSPIPPLVAAATLPPELHARLQALLLVLHSDRTGQAALDLGLIARFVGVDDSAYADIRQKARIAAGLRL